MLKAINTKILLAILAALTAIGGALTYQRHEAAKATAAAAKNRHVEIMFLHGLKMLRYG